MELEFNPEILSEEYRGRHGRESIFSVSGVTRSAGNALRYIMMTEIPSMAITDLEIEKNTSLFFEDHLKHRLGMINFKMNPDFFEEYEVGDDYTEFNSLKYVIKRAYEENESRQSTLLRTEDLLWEPMGDQEVRFGDESPQFVSSGSAIVMLRHGEEIDAVCYLTKGTQSRNARFSVVSSLRYHAKIDVVFEDSATPEEARELVDVCPTGVFDIEEIEDGVRIAKPLLCINCRRCLDVPGIDEILTVTPNEGILYFHIDSIGPLEPKDILLRAFDIYREQPNMRIVPFPTSMPSF